MFLQKGTNKDRILNGVLARMLIETASRIFTADNWTLVHLSALYACDPRLYPAKYLLTQSIYVDAAPMDLF